MVLGKELLPPQIKQQASDHADASGRKPILPAVKLTECSTHQRRKEGPQIYAHIEDGEGPVAARIALRVEAPHLRGDVRLKSSVADDKNKQARKKQRRTRQQKLADSNEDGSDN